MVIDTKEWWFRARKVEQEALTRIEMEMYMKGVPK